MLSLQEINALCQDLYFPADPCTIATFITAHTTLYYLFRDLSSKDLDVLDLNSSDVKSLVDMCVKNAQVAFKNLRLLMDPTYENLQALLIGVSGSLSHYVTKIQLTASIYRRSLRWTCHDRPLDGLSSQLPAGCARMPVIIAFRRTRSLQMQTRPRRDYYSGLYTQQTVTWPSILEEHPISRAMI